MRRRRRRRRGRRRQSHGPGQGDRRRGRLNGGVCALPESRSADKKRLRHRLTFIAGADDGRAGIEATRTRGDRCPISRSSARSVTTADAAGGDRRSPVSGGAPRDVAPSSELDASPYLGGYVSTARHAMTDALAAAGAGAGQRGLRGIAVFGPGRGRVDVAGQPWAAW